MSELLRELEQTLDKELVPLSLRIAKDFNSHNPLLSKEMQLKRVEDELRASSLNYRKMSVKGLELCLSLLEEIAEPIQVEKLKESLREANSRLQTKEQAQTFALQVIEGKSWRELLGIPQETINLLYRAAKQLLDSNAYHDAECAFSHLVLLDNSEYCFWLGLGMARAKQQNYSATLSAYQTASSLQPEAIWPYILQAECYEEQKEPSKAQELLAHAASLYKQQGLHDTILEKRLKRDHHVN